MCDSDGCTDVSICSVCVHVYLQVCVVGSGIVHRLFKCQEEEVAVVGSGAKTGQTVSSCDSWAVSYLYYRLQFVVLHKILQLATASDMLTVPPYPEEINDVQCK